MSQLDVNLLFELLRIQGTMDQVARLLRDKGLDHTASSWDDMINRRLKPYLHDKSLKIDEISLLLREIEEHGGQHILLYQLGRNEALGDLFSPGSLEERIEGLPDWPRVGEASFVN